MLASRRFFAFVFFFQSALLGLASPILSERDNHLHLKCTNAPTVTAGYYLDPKYAVAPNSTAATCLAEYEYLYCVPGTKTYIFFGTLGTPSSPLSAYATAIKSTIEHIKEIIKSQGDGLIPGGDQYFTTTGTDVELYAEDADKHHLTWGVCGAALQGLDAWMAAEGNEYSDATFQINDGPNWVGSGYMGAVNDTICRFANAAVPNTLCSATDPEGSVYGPAGLIGSLLCKD